MIRLQTGKKPTPSVLELAPQPLPRPLPHFLLASLPYLLHLKLRTQACIRHSAATVSSGPQPTSIYNTQSPVMLPPLHYQGLDAAQTLVISLQPTVLRLPRWSSDDDQIRDIIWVIQYLFTVGRASDLLFIKSSNNDLITFAKEITGKLDSSSTNNFLDFGSESLANIIIRWGERKGFNLFRRANIWQKSYTESQTYQQMVVQQMLVACECF